MMVGLLTRSNLVAKTNLYPMTSPLECAAFGPFQFIGPLWSIHFNTESFHNFNHVHCINITGPHGLL